MHAELRDRLVFTVIILTKNEEKHIGRAIASVSELSPRVLVVDSYSTDATVDIARSLGAEVFFKKWKNYSSQFNYALTLLSDSDSWVLRLDADEYVSNELQDDIRGFLENNCGAYDAMMVPRYVTFLGGEVRRGNLFPVWVVRLFKKGSGVCETRWMDEHIVVRGQIGKLNGKLVDDNLKSLGWWIEKHNSYASREAVDLLILKVGDAPSEELEFGSSSRQAERKRNIKVRVYSRLPGGFRAALYFFYRFFCCFGFADTREGRAYHVLQGFWYRYLVDMKVREVERYMQSHSVGLNDAVSAVLGINLRK